MDILIVGIVVAGLAVLFVVFLLGCARVSARSEQRAYIQNVLHAVEVRGEVDRRERGR